MKLVTNNRRLLATTKIQKHLGHGYFTDFLLRRLLEWPKYAKDFEIPLYISHQREARLGRGTNDQETSHGLNR